MMTEREKIEQWDIVDNAIFKLIKTLAPPDEVIKWDISIISEIREILQRYFVDELKVCSAEEFYPYTDKGQYYSLSEMFNLLTKDF